MKMKTNGDDNFSASSGDDGDSSSSYYSSDDSQTSRSSRSDADDHSHQDDDESSTQDVLMDDLLINNDDEFSESSNRKKIFVIAIMVVLLGGLLLNFSYVLVQLRDVSSEDRSTSSIGNNNIINNMNNINDMKNEDTMNENPQQTTDPNNEKKQQKSLREKTAIYKFAGLHGNKFRGGGVLSNAMIEQYEEDGVIVIRNLIPTKLLDKLDEASAFLVKEHQESESGKKKRSRDQFHMVKNGAIFLGVPPPTTSTPNNESGCSSNKEEGVCISEDTTDKTMNKNFTVDKTMSSFRHLALHSKIPGVAAALLRLDELRVGGIEYLNLPRQLPDDPNPPMHPEVDDSINLRVCRDIFLTKDDSDYACGWHVDDSGFWPAVSSDVGVNAWIALDDMPYHWSRKTLPADRQKQSNYTPIATFALSLGSHRAPWRQEAYEVTGSPHTAPPEGFLSADDMIERRTGSGTCNIKTSAPHLYKELEENKIIYDLKRGDVIFHDRWLFHRTVTVSEYEHQLKSEFGQTFNLEESDKIFRRYSIRYSPGSARVPPGYGVEPSVMYNAANANRTLDEISESDGPWYPKAWPRLGKEKENVEVEGIAELVHEKMPQAEKAREDRQKEIKLALKKKGGRRP